MDYKFIYLYLILLSSSFAYTQNNIPDFTFYEWKSLCDQLPKFNKWENSLGKTSVTEEILRKQLDIFIKTISKQLSNTYWINGFDKKSFYVEKILLPMDATVAIHGDFHGDINAINIFIEAFLNRGFLDKKNPFKIKDPNFYILFLGDYVDRGWYGAEVIYTILRLKNENPEQVFMVRGNHEDTSLNARYGFAYEIFKKFSSHALLNKIEQIYDLLPLALYIGTGLENKYDIIQCCHGGIELGFDPIILLDNKHKHACIKIDTLMQKDGFEIIKDADITVLKQFEQYFKNNKPINTMNGFMWNDFIVDPKKPMELSCRDGYSGIFFEYGKNITKKLLTAWSGTSYTLRAIFRAHQHTCDSMKKRILNEDELSHSKDNGAGKIWIEKNSIHKTTPALLEDVSVVTFSVAPENSMCWPYQAFGQLDMASEYKNWRLHILQIKDA